MFQSESAKDKDIKKYEEMASEYASFEESIEKDSIENSYQPMKKSKVTSEEHRLRVLERNPRLARRNLEPQKKRLSVNKEDK